MAWNDILHSIFKAARILGKDITERDIPDYGNYTALVKMNDNLWREVYNKRIKVGK